MDEISMTLSLGLLSGSVDLESAHSVIYGGTITLSSGTSKNSEGARDHLPSVQDLSGGI